MDLKCKLNKSKSEGINEMYPVWLKTKTKKVPFFMLIELYLFNLKDDEPVTLC